MVQPVARGTQAQEQEEKVKASKQAIRDFLITYQSMFPELQLTGNFNINSAIKSLENNVYFADKPEVIKQLQDAAQQGDIDSIKQLPIKKTNNKYENHETFVKIIKNNINILNFIIKHYKTYSKSL